MTAYPWYLLAVGIVIVIAGVLLALLAAGRSDQRHISAKMSDDEIARNLEGGGPAWPSLIIVVGFLCILASVVWRLVVRFV